MFKKSAAVLAIASSVLCGCGGGGATTEGGPRLTSLVVIGNSLTLVDGADWWQPARGMAASDLAHDYAHLVAAGLGIQQLDARNFASLERNPSDPINSVDLTTPMATQIAAKVQGITPTTAVIVELGDNVAPGSTADFKTNYGRLMDALPQRAWLICISTWWRDDAKDSTIRAACESHGGTYVFIGDIFPVRKDVAVPGEPPAVWDHPHDASMKIISDRILNAVG